MPKPQMQPPRTTAQKEAGEQVQETAETMPARVFGVVTAEGRCPTCGKVVVDVNAEPLDYDEREDGTLVVRSVVFVVLPCGHDFTRQVRVEE
ncbi:hypothetical protein [Actinoplanes solisilvae]|uniref:hypothetical protein n=1 Tax=Actinoplanes solisilvae TaxID=2486853 RepID=UPI000FDB5E10|nr:hypothetical protein [Actinoplanes solisilvae]